MHFNTFADGYFFHKSKSCNFRNKLVYTEKIKDLYILSKCPSVNPILHRKLKLNSKISAGKYKKNHRSHLIFPRGAKQKLCSKNAEISQNVCVVTLSKIQSAREAFCHLTLMEKCQTFYFHTCVFV